MEGFKKLTDQHNAVVLDDFSFKHVNRDTILAIVENDVNRTIKVCDSSVEKKKGKVQQSTNNCMQL